MAFVHHVQARSPKAIVATSPDAPATAACPCDHGPVKNDPSYKIIDSASHLNASGHIRRPQGDDDVVARCLCPVGASYLL